MRIAAIAIVALCMAAPAGACMVLLPMAISFQLGDGVVREPVVMACWLLAVAFLMISRIPTWSFKKTKVSRHNVKFFLVGFAVLSAALLIEPWVSLVVICLAYIGMVIWALLDRRTR